MLLLIVNCEAQENIHQVLCYGLKCQVIQNNPCQDRRKDYDAPRKWSLRSFNQSALWLFLTRAIWGHWGWSDRCSRVIYTRPHLPPPKLTQTQPQLQILHYYCYHPMAMICLVSQWIFNRFSVLLLFAAGPPLPHTSFFIILIIRDWVRLIMERFAIFEEGKLSPVQPPKMHL